MIMEDLFLFNEKFEHVHEDMEVRNTTFVSHKIMLNKCAILNS